MNTTDSLIPQQIESLASQCVMCAACSPTCPTYQLSLDENKSPRGRIAIIRAISQNKLELNKQSIEHLSTCLHCLSCQKICPSQVQYDQLIHYAQQQIVQSKKKPEPLLTHISRLLLTHSSLKRLAVISLNFLIQLHIMSILKSCFRSRLLSYLPDSLIKKTNNATDSKTLILAGCANELFNANMINHTQTLLNHLNIPNKIIPGCCGAMNYRLGIKEEKLLFPLEHTIISLNSACSAHLMTNEEVESIDIIEYLFKKKTILKFKPLNKTLLYHFSCSVRNRLNNAQQLNDLLALIPGLKIVSLMESGCCGASGQMMFSNAPLADSIASPYLEKIKKSQLSLMLTTDISCGIHIRQQLEVQNYKLEVLHPISLLYQQLR